MKKLLLLFFVIFTLDSFGIVLQVYVYQNCNGNRGTPIYIAPDDNFNFLNIGCLKLCNGCKLEITLKHMDGTSAYNVTSPNSRLTWSPDGIIGFDVFGALVEENGIKYASFDLSSIPQGSQFYVYLGGSLLDFSRSCNSITASNNKDNIQIDNKQICKGECITIGSLISPNDKVEITSFGCGPNPLVPSGGMGWTTLHANQECFNTVGSFPICATVKDACGEKKLQGNINVIDCTNGVNCESCCNLLNNITSQTIGNWFLGGNLMLPNDFFGCGPLDVYIYFSDGTSIVARGSGLVNLGGKTVTSICFVPALGCNSCAKCIQVGG